MSNFNLSNLSNIFWTQAQQILRPLLPQMGGAMPGNNNPGTLGTGGRSAQMSLMALFGNTALKMDPQELSTLLKDSMKLPQEMRLLLMMLAVESSPEKVKVALAQTLKQAIEESPQPLAVPLTDLQELLAKKSKEGTEKLLKLLQLNQTSQGRGGQQVIELMGTLARLSEKIQTSPKEATETLMLLYIPWYPLAPQQKLEVGFEGGGAEEEEAAAEDCSIVLFLETAVLGRFKVTVEELNPLQLVATIGHEAHAAHILPKLERNLNEMLAHEGLPAVVFESNTLQPEQWRVASKTEADPAPSSPPETEGSGFKGLTRQADHKAIQAQQGSRVSVLLLNCAYTIARFIFEADDTSRVLQGNG